MLVNLTSFVKNPWTPEASFDYGKFRNVAKKAQRLMDDMIDLEIEQIDKILENRDKINTDEHVQIITAAPWIMIPVVLRGGWNALWDISVALPMIVIAHLKADWQNIKKKIFN